MLAATFFLQMTVQELLGFEVIRVLILVVLFLAAGWTLLASPMLQQSVSSSSGGFSFLDLIVVIILPLQSLITGFLGSGMRPIMYSLLLVLSYASVRVMAHRLGIVRIMTLFLNSATVASLAAISMGYQEFINGLSLEKDVTLLSRFAPFGMHPNLAGHVYAMAAGLAIIMAIANQPLKDRIFRTTQAFILLLPVLSANSRGSLLALLLALCVTLIPIYRHLPAWLGERQRANFRSRVMIAGLVAVIAILFSGGLFVEFLQINSEYRGVGSGFSGRDQNWLDIVEMTWAEPTRLILGEGLRTWDGLAMGFDTDSSYVNMLWELGLPLTLVVFAAYIYMAGSALGAISSGEAALILFVIAFALIEGVFARYSFAIGNPASLIVLAAAGTSTFRFSRS